MINIAGKRFGKLIAINATGKTNNSKNMIWEFRCDCGGKILAPTNRLKTIKSCGCISHYKSKKDAFDRNTKIKKECIEWIGTINNKGYGVLKYLKKTYQAHRLSYEIHHGEIPKGMVIRHLCHNKKCVNPQHLALGTYKENSQDSVKAGRNNRGKDVNTAKLNDDKVLEIRRMCDKKEIKQRDIAKKFGVHEDVIYCIKKRKTWKHI